jgi:inosine-uridine nucleoside N-ribohydrolase
MAEFKPLIIDTACGVDDALALLVGITQAEKYGFKIVAITTCVGNVSVE